MIERLGSDCEAVGTVGLSCLTSLLRFAIRHSIPYRSYRSPSSRFPVLRSLPSLRRPSHSNRFAREWRRRERSEGYDMNEEAVR